MCLRKHSMYISWENHQFLKWFRLPNWLPSKRHSLHCEGICSLLLSRSFCHLLWTLMAIDLSQETLELVSFLILDRSSQRYFVGRFGLLFLSECFGYRDMLILTMNIIRWKLFLLGLASTSKSSKSQMCLNLMSWKSFNPFHYILLHSCPLWGYNMPQNLSCPRHPCKQESLPRRSSPFNFGCSTITTSN